MTRPIPFLVRAAIVLLAGGVVGATASARAQLSERAFTGSLEHPAIEYRTRPGADAVSALNREIDAGRVQLTFDERSGYLRSVLDALRVAIESQVMVFSKTGAQRDFTDPRNPRALFFNDSVVVGLMRYPCSYMIYTDAFDRLPAEARDAIYQRMWHVLSGREKGPRYARLSTESRRAIVEIVHDTKKGLPEYFR